MSVYMAVLKNIHPGSYRHSIGTRSLANGTYVSSIAWGFCEVRSFVSGFLDARGGSIKAMIRPRSGAALMPAAFL